MNLWDVNLKHKSIIPMITTYHLSSASEIDARFIEKLKNAYSSNPITIIVEESESIEELPLQLKNLLDDRLLTKDEEFISAEESIKRLKEKYDKL